MLFHGTLYKSNVQTVLKTLSFYMSKIYTTNLRANHPGIVKGILMFALWSLLESKIFYMEPNLHIGRHNIQIQ